jgi:thiamine pyrophosphokinase
MSSETSIRAYIFLNGDFEKPLRDWPEIPADCDLVLAADGGGRHVHALGWPLHNLVGDFDSLEPEILADFEKRGIEISRHPVEKDEIDFELALKMARRKGYEDIDVLGALGGRWDMTFANLFLPRSSAWGSGRIRFRHGPWNFFLISGPTEFVKHGKPGDLFSLLPVGEDVRGVTLEGCYYPLHNEVLRAGFSRGLSNRLTAPTVRLKFGSGALLIAHRAEEEE